jgi:putative spermidine/putrescine transport system substrate-binding protein
MTFEGINRRDLLKRGLQLSAAAGVAGCGGVSFIGCGDEEREQVALPEVPRGAAEWEPSATPPKDRMFRWENLPEGKKARATGITLSTIGLGVSVQDRFLREFERRTGHKAQGKVTTLTAMITEWLGGGASRYTTVETNANRNAALWDRELLLAIPTEQVVPWKFAHDLFTSKKARGYDKNNGWPLVEVWADPNRQKEFRLVPQFFNCDSIGYRPDLVGGDIDSWGALVDPKYKGKSAILNDSLLTPGWCAGYMKANGLAKIKDTANLSHGEVDQVIDFLIEKKKDGQFRAIWEDYGQCVNLLAAGEAVVTDAWNPVVEDVKKQGVACKYAFPKEGFTAWFHGVAIRKDTPEIEAALDYVNFCLEGWWGAQVATQGYYSPTTTAKVYLDKLHRTSKRFTDWQWWYEGGAGPAPKNDYPTNGRDTGSFDTRWGNIMHWMVWPDDPDYYAERWNDFLAA